MHRIDTANAATTLPTPSTAGTPGYFAHGNPASGTNYTTVSSDWCNAVQEELISVLAAAGLSPSKTSQNQLLAALRSSALGRMKLLSPLYMYVDGTNGNDNNDGLGSAAGTTSSYQPAGASLTNLPSTTTGPVKTLQAPITKLTAQYDINGQPIKVFVANGTYSTASTAVLVNGAVLQGLSSIQFINVAGPGSCTITIPTSGGFGFLATQGAMLGVKGFTLNVPSGANNTNWVQNGIGLFANNNGIIQFHNCTFAACNTAHIMANAGGIVQAINSDFMLGSQAAATYNITGGSTAHLWAGFGGLIQLPQTVVTITGTPAFSSAFAYAENGGAIGVLTPTFSGATTGARYSTVFNGEIIGTGGNATLFPGSVAGTTANGGSYS